MEFEPLALLPAGPVHEKTHMAVNQQNRHEHVHANRERHNTREETEQQRQGSEELRADNQPAKKCGKTHPCEQRQSAVRAATSEEAKQFLGAMRKEDYGEQHSQHGQYQIIRSSKKSLEHEPPKRMVLEHIWLQKHGLQRRVSAASSDRGRTEFALRDGLRLRSRRKAGRDIFAS
jgi:hypothetical protein